MIEHLSYSMVNMLSRCPRQFWYCYILKLRIPPGAAMVFGTSYHSTAEENFTYKLNTGNDFSAEMAKAVFSDTWDNKVDEVEWGYEEDRPGELKDIGVGLVGKYVTEFAPKRFPVAVEKEFEINIPEVERPFRGKIDFIGQDNFLLEHKTANKSWPESRLENTDQVQAYYLAYMNLTGEWPTGFGFDIAVKTKKPKIQDLYTSRTSWQVEEYVGRLKTAEALISADVYPKTDPTNWFCSRRWCGYYGNCMAGEALSRIRVIQSEKEDNTDDSL
jgi:CRISPR/Cas system-associated exonuclease Cas4 (RecB family)